MLRQTNIREDFSINRSFCRGSSTAAQVAKAPPDIIKLINRWKNFKRSKGRKAKLSMLETYAEVKFLVPKMIQYSAMLRQTNIN